MLLRPALRPVLRPALRPPFVRGSVGFAVAQLFAAGEQGVWYDPSDFSTMFQDSAGTTPVTATGQPVGKILDKSGRGNHATQATTANRPTLQQDGSGYYYLSFNGTNSWLLTGNIPFTSQQMTVWAGLNVQASTNGIVVELTNGLLVGGFNLATGVLVVGNDYASTNPGSIGRNYTNTRAVPRLEVACASFDNAAGIVVLRLNGTGPQANSTAPTGTAAFSNAPLYIGARGDASLFFTGGLYGLICRGAASALAQTSSGERYVGQKMGIVL